MSSALGQMVAAARRRAGYRTIYAFSQATGISSGQLSEIERGVSSPSIATLERIFDTIGWSVKVVFLPPAPK